MSYKLYQFGLTVLPNYNPESDISTGKAKIPVIDLPGGGAYDPLGIEVAPVGATDLTKRCTLFADTQSALADAYDELTAWVGKRDKLYQYKFSDGSTRFCYARCEEVKIVRKYGDKLQLDVDISFVKLSPTWSGTFHSVTFTKGQLTTDGNVEHLQHNGNANQDDVVITVTGSGSDVTSVAIHKTSASGATIFDDIVWSGALGAGQELVIDTGAQTVEKQGVNEYDNFFRGAGHQEDVWFRLWGPTSNRIEVAITGGDNSASIKFEYYDASR